MTMRAPIQALAVAALLALAASGGSIAQQEQDVNRTPQGRGPAKARQAAAAARAAQQGSAPAAAAPASSGGQVLENVQRQEEASQSPKGLTYDPGDRRDPFISPAEAVKAEDVGQCQGEGTECWLITEINLVGILQRRGGGVALVIGPEGYGSTLKAGDKLYDGEVLSVDGNTGTVVFRQKVNDPTRIKPYRDIEKKMNVSREGGV
jgi:hypothetical protein